MTPRVVKEVQVGKSIKVGGNQPLLLIAGPCQIESLEHSLSVAEFLQRICRNKPVNLVFKASYDKANRTSISGARGPGIERGLEILSEVAEKTGLPVLTDVHAPHQVREAAAVAEIIQIPAFLCRQTDLLLAAGGTGKAVNIKKGQYLHPSDMRHVAEKVVSTGNQNILLCERGTCFGYRDLVVDMRGLEIMRNIGYPVIFDATHSVQSMGGAQGSSSGERQFIAPLVRAAAAVGIDGLFVECHENPARAPSDGDTMLPLEQMESVLNAVLNIRDAVR